MCFENGVYKMLDARMASSGTEKKTIRHHSGEMGAQTVTGKEPEKWAGRGPEQ